MSTKTKFQKVIAAIRKEVGGDYPKAMMTGQQMKKNTATVNCGGEWRSKEFSEMLAAQVTADPGFQKFLKEENATANIEANPFGGVQVRINFKKEEETMEKVMEIKEVKDELTGEVAEVEVKETEDGFTFEETVKAPEVTMVEAYPVEEEEEDTTATTMIVKVEKLNGPATYAAKEVKVGWQKVVVITTDDEDIVFPRKSFYMRANGKDTYLFTKVEIDGKEIPTRFYEDEDFRGVYRKANYEVTREAL